MVAFHIHFLGIDDSRAASAAQFYLSRALSEMPGVLVRLPVRLRNTLRESLVLGHRAAIDLVEQKLRDFRCPFRFQIAELAFPDVYFEKPLFIVGAPRSGTTLLFETLTVCPGVWALRGESHPVFERPGEVPTERGNRLEATDADPETRTKVRLGFLSAIRDRDKRYYSTIPAKDKSVSIQLLEKTPRNSLRIPFLKSVFPDCRFVFLYRQPHTNIASLMEIWNTPGTHIHNEAGFEWRFLFPPGWREMIGKPIAEIAAAQWVAANEFIVEDLAKLPREDWDFIRYEDLIKNPATEIARICRFGGLEMDDRLLQRVASPLPLSRTTKTLPSPEKWRRYETELNEILPSTRKTSDTVDAFIRL